MIRQPFIKLAKRSFITCLLASAVVVGGCSDDDSPTGPDPSIGNDPGDPPPAQEVVLFEETIEGPIAVAGQAFTPIGTFAASSTEDVQVTVTSTVAQSNVLIDVGLAQGGFSRNVAQFQDGDANPATLTVTNPQPGEGNALRIADGAGALANAVYTVRVVQVED
jgi:hypothetical protein